MSVGGPIIKDKLFFFADWDRVKTSKVAIGALNVNTVPTQVAGTGGFNGAGAADFSATTTAIIDPSSICPMLDRTRKTW